MPRKPFYPYRSERAKAEFESRRREWAKEWPVSSETHALDIIGDVGLSVNHGKISTYEDLVRWLDEVVRVLVPEGPVSLVGLSFGGAIAAQYARSASLGGFGRWLCSLRAPPCSGSRSPSSPA